MFSNLNARTIALLLRTSIPLEGRLLGAIPAGGRNEFALASGMYLVVFEMENGERNVERLIVQ